LRDWYDAFKKLIVKFWCELTVLAVSFGVVGTRKTKDKRIQKDGTQKSKFQPLGNFHLKVIN
jgi:hypothetical protein